MIPRWIGLKFGDVGGQGLGSTFLLNVNGGAGALFGRHKPAKMGRETCKNFR